MTVTLHLTPEIEADLQAKAQERGLPIEKYLLILIESSALPARDEKALAGRAEAVSRMIEFGDKHRLSLDEPVTRALLHEGHRF